VLPVPGGVVSKCPECGGRPGTCNDCGEVTHEDEAKRVNFWIGLNVKVTFPDDGCGEIVRFGVIHSHRNGVYLIADGDGDALCLATLSELTRLDYEAPAATPRCDNCGHEDGYHDQMCGDSAP
jgi:hypothetical protein